MEERTRSHKTAKSFVDDIRTALSKYRSVPEAGVAKPALGRGLRVIYYRSYGIYYRFTPSDLIVVRIVHSAQDLERIAGVGGFGAPV